MTFNLFKLKINDEVCHLRVKLSFKRKRWCYEIDNFAFYPIFVIELNEQNKWKQSAGIIAVNQSLINEIGNALEDNCRNPFNVIKNPS